jgi:uncharacterized phiE125 gp8 family phage protein
MLGAPVLVTPPVGDLIELASAMSFLRVDADELQTEVEVTLAAAIEDIQEMTGLRLLDQTVRVSADRFCDLERFRVGPIRSITSIKYLDTDRVQQTLDASVYELFGSGFEKGVRLKSEQSWPTIEAVEAAIEVTLAVGYGTSADVPAPLRFAVLAQLRAKFDGQEANLEALLANHRIWL